MGGCLSATTKRQVIDFCDKPNGGMLALLGLQVVLEYGRSDSARPPVTAALIVANSLVYLRFGDLRRILPLNLDMSFNPYRIIEVQNTPNPPFFNATGGQALQDNFIKRHSVQG